MTRTDRHAPHPTGTGLPELRPAEVEAHLIARDATVLDVRDVEEVAAQGWIAGAVHVPADALDVQADPSRGEHHPQLDPDRLTIVVHNGADARSTQAAQTLVRLGYRELARLAGGLEAWERAGYPVAGRARWHPALPAR